MTTMTEGDLRFTFPDAIGGIQFDDAKHGLSYCMKAVDFIVEFEQQYIFVEIKDLVIPDSFSANAPGRSLEKRESDSKKFIEKFQSDKLRPELVSKFRDSFIYRWAQGLTNKPIYYLLVLELPSVSEEDLMTKAEELQRAIPVKDNGVPIDSWNRPIAKACKCFTVDTWGTHFKGWTIERVSGD